VFNIIGIVGFAVLGVASLLGFYQQTTKARVCHAPGKFIMVGAARIHFVQREDGDIPVVLWHGASSNAREWKLSLFDYIPETFHLVAIDRSG